MNGVESETGPWLYKDIYNKGFAGAWGWTLDDPSMSSYLLPGMKSLDGKAGVDFAFTAKANVPNTCNCADIPPDS
jgi:hypothetical protein